MDFNINVKVRGGPRTPVEVVSEATGVNTKVMKFKNGKTVTDNAIAQWIETNLVEMLTEYSLKEPT